LAFKLAGGYNGNPIKTMASLLYGNSLSGFDGVKGKDCRPVKAG
jgi:hypothetical protein